MTSTPAAHEKRGSIARTLAVSAAVLVSLALFYLAASKFYYHGEGGLLSDLRDYFSNLVAAPFAGGGGFFSAIGRLIGAFLDFGPLLTIIFVVSIAVRIFFWMLENAGAEAASNLLRDKNFRNIISELIVLTALFVFVWWLLGNTIYNLQARKIASGFGFLSTTAGFGINQVLFLQYSEESSYGVAFLAGLYNTLVVSFIGIIFATILGFIVGIMRLSHNWIIARIAAGYVELFRNIPLLLQIIVWYKVVLGPLPAPRRSLKLFESLFINNRGVYSPKPIFADAWWYVVAAFFFGIVATFFLARWAKKRQEATGQPFPVFLSSLGLIFGLPIVVFFLSGMPVHFDYPHLKGFNFQGGMRIIPEFIAMLMALSIYTATFIAEIVRAGIQAVSHGQTEAALALGLTRGQMLRLVVIPQALRVIIPPLTSQYLNLTKNSSLAVAIAYPDLVAVGGTILNQTGQAIEIIGLWMIIYLTISLATSAFMNWYNARMKLVER